MSTVLPHRLAAVWFADIAGYSRLTVDNEDAALRLVKLFQESARWVVKRHAGRLIKFQGDSALAEFSSTEAAVKAGRILALTFQRRAEEAGLASPPLHLGIHVGEVARAPDGDLYGEGVNIAARLEELSEPGQFLASEDVWRQLHQREGFRFASLGERTLAGAREPLHVYEIRSAGVEEAWDAGRAAPGGRWGEFFAELRRRRVLRVALAYAVAGWLAMLAAALGFSALGLPASAAWGVVVAVVAGFPLALVVAWTYEITADGLHRRVLSPAETSISRRQRLAWLGLGILVALFGFGLSARYLPMPGPTPEPAAVNWPPSRIAVLYFDDFSPGHRLEYLVDGLTEALIHEIGEVPGLEVVSRNGVKPYRDASIPVDSVARALRVGTLVQGSVAESGDRLRVAVQMIDGPTGTLLESETIERPRGELFALQDDLARQVADFLRRRLGEEIRLHELTVGTRDVAAWELVQRAEGARDGARTFVESGDLAAAGRQYDYADSLLARAAARDSAWPRPLIERARLAYERGRWFRFSDVERLDRWIDVGLGYVQRALALAPGDPDALELRGELRWHRWSYVPEADAERAAGLLRAAESDLRAAVAGNPQQAGAWAWLSQVESARGNTGEAYLAAQKAYQADAYLDNARDVIWWLAISSYDLDRPEEARRWCLEGQRRFPEFYRFTECKLWLMTMSGIPPEPARAWSLLREFRSLTPPQEEAFLDRRARMAVAAVVARAGLRDSARAVATAARAGSGPDPSHELAYYEAFVRTLLGDRSAALDDLEEYLAANPGDRSEAARTWWFEPLHDEPRFRRLVGESVD